jgi:hypothetical protein
MKLGLLPREFLLGEFEASDVRDHGHCAAYPGPATIDFVNVAVRMTVLESLTRGIP